MALVDEINRADPKIRKNIYIKRRLRNPTETVYFENDWQDITKYLATNGISRLSSNIDSVELNQFTQGGFSLKLRNEDYQFADVTKSKSLFYEFLTRHKTKVKVEATYIADDDTEYTYSIGSGLINGAGISATSKGIINIPVVAPTTLLDDQPADNINDGENPGGATKWYSDEAISTIVGYIYDLAIRGYKIFTPYYEGSVINPANDVQCNSFDFNSWSCRLALREMAEVSNSCFYIGEDWKFYFEGRDPSAASQFSFSSHGSNANILAAYEYNEGVKSVINRVQWFNANPQVISEDQEWELTPTSSIFRYGVKPYIISNRLITSLAKRQTLCDSIRAAYQEPKEQIKIVTKFCPQLKILDKVWVDYRGVPAVTNPSLWGSALWKRGIWSGFKGGIKIKKYMKIMGKNHDANKFVSTFDLEAV